MATARAACPAHSLGYAPFEAVVSRSGKVSKKKVERAALLSGAVRDVIFVGREFAKPAED